MVAKLVIIPPTALPIFAHGPLKLPFVKTLQTLRALFTKIRVHALIQVILYCVSGALPVWLCRLLQITSALTFSYLVLCTPLKYVNRSLIDKVKAAKAVYIILLPWIVKFQHSKYIHAELIIMWINKLVWLSLIIYVNFMIYTRLMESNQWMYRSYHIDSNDLELWSILQFKSVCIHYKSQIIVSIW